MGKGSHPGETPPGMSFIVTSCIGKVVESRNPDLVDKAALAESGSHSLAYVK